MGWTDAINQVVAMVCSVGVISSPCELNHVARQLGNRRRATVSTGNQLVETAMQLGDSWEVDRSPDERRYRALDNFTAAHRDLAIGAGTTRRARGLAIDGLASPAASRYEHTLAAKRRRIRPARKLTS